MSIMFHKTLGYGSEISMIDPLIYDNFKLHKFLERLKFLDELFSYSILNL